METGKKGGREEWREEDGRRKSNGARDGKVVSIVVALGEKLEKISCVR